MTFSKAFRAISAAGMAAILSACGTTYTMPGIGDETTSRASVMFAEAKAAPPRALASQSTGVARFNRVARRVEPVASRRARVPL